MGDPQPAATGRAEYSAPVTTRGVEVFDPLRGGVIEANDDGSLRHLVGSKAATTASSMPEVVQRGILDFDVEGGAPVAGQVEDLVERWSALARVPGRTSGRVECLSSASVWSRTRPGRRWCGPATRRGSPPASRHSQVDVKFEPVGAEIEGMDKGGQGVLWRRPSRRGGRPPGRGRALAARRCRGGA